MAVNNNTILTKAWLAGTNDFQQRIPDPSQASMAETMDALFDPMNRQYWNQFVDTLINRIGRTIVRGQRWENKLRAFKQDNLRYGNTIQEIAPKWIKAHSYTDFDETLLKLARPEAQAWYHSVNRQDRYDISINDMELRRAFTEEYGLNDFVAKVMQVPYNSDAYDEYNCMKQLIALYEDKWGFFKVNLSAAPTTEATGKELLTKVRTYAGKLAFPSTLYNAQDITDIPVFANPDELVILTTPEVQANLDVQTLAGVFQLDKADLMQKVVIIDEFPIADAQMLLTTRDWFVVHDVVYETTSFYNPQTLSTNYYLHHHEIVSCSPFVPAILFTTDAATSPAVLTQTVTGITVTAVEDTLAPGEETQLIVKLQGSLAKAPGTRASETITEMDGIVVAPDAATFELHYEPTSESSTAQLNSRTYVDRLGVLHVQKSGIDAGVIHVTAKATYTNPSGETTEYADGIEIAIA